MKAERIRSWWHDRLPQTAERSYVRGVSAEEKRKVSWVWTPEKRPPGKELRKQSRFAGWGSGVRGFSEVRPGPEVQAGSQAAQTGRALRTFDSGLPWGERRKDQKTNRSEIKEVLADGGYREK